MLPQTPGVPFPTRDYRPHSCREPRERDMEANDALCSAGDPPEAETDNPGSVRHFWACCPKPRSRGFDIICAWLSKEAASNAKDAAYDGPYSSA